MSTRLFTRWGLVGIVAVAMVAPQLVLAGTPRLQLNSDNYSTGDSITLTVTNADANTDVIVVASNWQGSYSNPQMTLGRTDGSGRWVSDVFTVTGDFRSSCSYKVYVLVNGKQSNEVSYCVNRTSENPGGVHGYVVQTQNSFQYVEAGLDIDGRTRITTSGGFYETRDLEPGSHTITVLTPNTVGDVEYRDPEYNICSGGADCGRNSGGWTRGDTARFDVTAGNIATVYFRFLATDRNGNPLPGGGTEPETCNAAYGSCSAGAEGSYRCRNAANYQKCERVDKNNDGFAIFCWNAPTQCPVAAPVCTGNVGDSITDDPNNAFDTPVCTNALQGPTPSTQFQNGAQVEVTDNGVSVRGAPAGSWAATRNAGAKGTIAASPAIPAKLNGIWYQWWKVNFGSLLGWVAEDFLRLAGTSPNTYVDAGADISGTFSGTDTRLYAYLNASVYVNGVKRDDIQNNGFVMWRVTSKDGVACGADNCGVTFENPGNQGQDPTVVFSSKGNYQLQFCAPFITPCDNLNATIRQGGTTACNTAKQQAYLNRFCPPGFDPTQVQWGGTGGISPNPWGPYHACNIPNLPRGGINAGGCSGKYNWPNGGDTTSPTTPSTPSFNDGQDAYGYAHLVAEAWNPNWTRALNLNGIPTRSGQWNLAARYIARQIGVDGPYKWLGIPSGYADFLPEGYAYATPEELAAGPGQLPLCMQDYSVNAQVYGMARGWWGLPGSDKNPDGSRPGRRIPQTGKCVPDWRSWRPGLDPIPQYTGGPGPGAANGSCGGPISTADEVNCGGVEDQFYCTANKTTAAIGEPVTFTAFGATPVEWNSPLGATPRQQSGGQTFTVTWQSVNGSMNQSVSFLHRTDGSTQSESCSVLLYDPNPPPPPPPPPPAGPLSCSGGDAIAGTTPGTAILRAFDVTGTSAMSFGVYPVRSGVRKYELTKWSGGSRVGASRTFRGSLTAAQFADPNFGDGAYGASVWLWGPDVAGTSDDVQCATFDFTKSGNTITMGGGSTPPPPPPPVAPPPPPAGPLPAPSCSLTVTPGGTTKQINTRFNVTSAFSNADYITVTGPGWSGTIDCGLHDDNGDGIGDRFDPTYATPYSCRAAFLRTASGGSYDLGTTPNTWGNLFMREVGTASVTITPKRYNDGAIGAPCSLTITGTSSGGGAPPPPPPPPPAGGGSGCYFTCGAGEPACKPGGGGCWNGFQVNASGQAIPNTITSPCVPLTPGWTPRPANYCGVPTGTGPTLTFTAAPTSIAYGSQTTLSWESPDAQSCTPTEGIYAWTGNTYKPIRGSETFRPAQSTTFGIKCVNFNGETIKTARVEVTPLGTPPPPPPAAGVQAPTYNNDECSVTNVTQLGGGLVKLRVVKGTALPDSVGFWNLSRGVGTATWIGRGSWTMINSTTYDVTLSAADHANTYGRYQASFWKWGTSDATNILCSEVQFDIPRPTASLDNGNTSALANTLQGLRDILTGLQSALGR